eukprot:Trichotokara_eunicae@DN1549_c0_g1_i4.p1
MAQEQRMMKTNEFHIQAGECLPGFPTALFVFSTEIVEHMPLAQRIRFDEEKAEFWARQAQEAQTAISSQRETKIFIFKNDEPTPQAHRNKTCHLTAKGFHFGLRKVAPALAC